MAREGDIVPFPLHRTPSRPFAETTRGERRWIGLILGASLLSLVALALLVTQQDQHAIARMASERRAGIFERAHADMIDTCGLPDARSGPLRQHCLDQANFVLLFPECDTACRETARRLLPHATR